MKHLPNLPNAGRNVIRDFGTFREISSRYLDNPRFDDYTSLKSIKEGRSVL
jgi:hypothetical protein